MAVYQETIQLNDEVSGPAKTARDAVQDLASSLQRTQAIAAKGAPGGGAPSGGAPSGGAPPGGAGTPANDVKSATGGIKGMWADADHAMQVGKESIGAALGSIKAAFASLAQGDAKGVVVGITQSVADLSKMLDLAVPGLGTAVSTVISIIGGLAGAFAGLIQQGMAFAISANQEKAAMISMFDAMGNGVSTGEELDDMLSELSAEIGISKDKLVPLTKEFLKMGVTGTEALKELTLAAESANAIVGEGGAQAFMALQKRIQLAAETGGKFKLGQKQLMLLGQAGVQVSDVAKQMGMDTKDLAAQLEAGSIDAKKFGDALSKAVIEKGAKPLERLASSFGEIKAKFMADVGDMFEDIDVGPFMKEVKDLFGIFSSQSKPSGEALKFGIQLFFQQTFDVAKKLVPMVKHFLLDMIIYGLQAYIALKPTITALKEWLASAEGLKAQHELWEVLKGALMAIGIVIGVVVGAVVLLVAIFATIFTTVWSLVGLFLGPLVDAFMVVFSYVGQAVTMGEDFVRGLVEGITGGAQWLIDAVKALAGGAVDTLIDVFKIGSPSKVGMDIGYNLGSSVGMGTEAANDVVADASSAVASSAVSGMATGASAPTGAAAPSAGGAANVFYITIEGAGKNAEEIVDEIQAASWERMALASGG